MKKPKIKIKGKLMKKDRQNSQVLIAVESLIGLIEGESIEIKVAVSDADLLNAEDGIVWATYDKNQAETIQNALSVQDIPCQISQVEAEIQGLFLLRIQIQHKINQAMDFIWRDDAGMRLKPDWYYEKGQVNRSFTKWCMNQ